MGETMNTETQIMTADQLFQMRDDGFRHELVKGELRKMTPTGFNHGEIVMNLAAPLGTYIRNSSLGVVLGAETGFKINSDPDTVRAPDIAFVRKERVLETGRTDKFWPGAPDLAVEVLSPTDTAYEVEEKVANWLGAGTQVVWVLNPRQRTLHVHRANSPVQVLGREDFLEGQDVVPGFRINLSEVFV
jgi:Uma2 family endonuclease